MEERVNAANVCMMIEKLNKKILKWWKNLPDLFKSNLPTFIHELIEVKILFVGLNPGGRNYPAQPIPNISDEKINDIIDKEKVAIFGVGEKRIGQYKRYYGWLSNISDKLEIQYEHYDLFHMSYSPSREVLKEIFEENSKINLKKKHSEHLSIFKQVLNIVKPKVVITNNVNTANILKSYLKLKFDHETGLYKDKKGRFFYLNGIMSYGRQTEYDNERLIWLIKDVLYE